MPAENNRPVMLVTGANSGLGLATSVGLAKTGAEVIMLCRDQERGQAALAEATLQTGNSGTLTLMQADLSDLNSVAAFCREFKQKYDRLDVLVNNAGVIVLDRRETSQGLELQFGVNHIGHFLLTLLLSDLLIKTAGSRVVTVSSGAHKAGKIHFDDINLKNKYGAIKSYSQSKLANILFTSELSRRLSDYGVIANCYHPGAVATRMGVDRKTGFGKTIMKILKPFFRTPEQGASTAIFLALSQLAESDNGAYYYNSKKKKTSSEAQDLQSAQRLWELSLNIVRPWLSEIEDKLL